MTTLRTTLSSIMVGLVTVGTVAASGTLEPAPATAVGIESRFHETYVYRRYFKDDTIKILARGDRYVLTGTVSDSTHKLLAQETVTGLAGTMRVEDQLLVESDIPMAHSDAWVKARIRYMLAFHRTVDASTPEVDVQQGRVILRGQGASALQRKLSSQYAKLVDGVKDVRNDMTVSGFPAPLGEEPAGAIDDVSITVLVKMTLRYHYPDGTFAPKVTTNDGVVTLTGRARSTAERDVDGMLACDVQGVQCVLDTEAGVTAYCAVPISKRPDQVLAAIAQNSSQPERMGAYPR